MQRDDWWNLVLENKKDIENCIIRFHPASNNKVEPRLDITAPNAERACEFIRNYIKHSMYDPIEDFRKYADARNYEIIVDILNQTWFGVPESTDCWNIPGFEEIVALLEDPIER